VTRLSSGAASAESKSSVLHEKRRSSAKGRTSMDRTQERTEPASGLEHDDGQRGCGRTMQTLPKKKTVVKSKVKGKKKKKKGKARRPGT